MRALSGLAEFGEEIGEHRYEKGAVMVAKNEEFALALQELREVHETQKRVLGDDHEDTSQLVVAHPLDGTESLTAKLVNRSG